MAELLDDLKRLIRTRHAIVTIQTLDEAFAVRQIHEAGQQMGLAVLEWSVSDGLHHTAPTACEVVAGTKTLVAALKFIRDNEAINVYIFKDALRYVKDAVVERLLRDTAQAFSQDNRTIFLVDPGGEMPSSLHPLTVSYDLALPDENEIYQVVKDSFQKLTEFSDRVVDMTESQFHQFLANLRGLTRMEIWQVVAEAVLGDGKLSVDDVTKAIEIKRQRLRQSGVLDYIPPPKEIPGVGGMKNLQKWLDRRSKAFSAKARKYGLESPRGILILGMQGCGKSLMARFVAAAWKMPLLRMDVGALYDKYIGETERHLRRAFKVASVISPCILWIDEIEKAFASASAGPESDGGLSKRMFGQLLTWMQDRPEPIFLVATANDISALPPELVRKGRFDEIFFVDLPGSEARKTIFEIHLAKRNRDPAAFDTDALAQASEGFSGSEIEQAIMGAMYAAFSEKQELQTQDILTEISQTQPLSVFMAEKIDAVRDWALSRCVRAD